MEVAAGNLEVVVGRVCVEQQHVGVRMGMVLQMDTRGSSLV
jgi:hypothetical protein